MKKTRRNGMYSIYDTIKIMYAKVKAKIAQGLNIVGVKRSIFFRVEEIVL